MSFCLVMNTPWPYTHSHTHRLCPFHHTATTVRPLKELCRFTISATLVYKDRLKLLNSLPLPQHLLRFVYSIGSNMHHVCLCTTDCCSAAHLQLLTVYWCGCGVSVTHRAAARYGIHWSAIANSDRGTIIWEPILSAVAALLLWYIACAPSVWLIWVAGCILLLVERWVLTCHVTRHLTECACVVNVQYISNTRAWCMRRHVQHTPCVPVHLIDMAHTANNGCILNKKGILYALLLLSIC